MDDLDQSYQEQVSELPAQGYTSAGKLIWQASSDNFVEGFTDFHYSNNAFGPYRNDLFPYMTSSFVFSVLDDGVSFSSSGSLPSTLSGFYFRKFSVPVSGLYRLLNTRACFVRVVTKEGQIIENTYNFLGSSTFARCSVRDEDGLNYIYSYKPPSFPAISYSVSFYSIWYYPTYEVIPDSAIFPSNVNPYTPDTRPTVITGDYGIVDNQGVATVIKDCTIVNETTNNYYNPATGQNYPIKDWSYDYPSREYTITTDSNNTVTITYGDENVTIQEGDTIYNIYYVVDGIGEEKPPCAHDWQKGNRTDPTCAQPGLQVYTCSKCGERKSETIPTTAHDWQAETKTDPTCAQPGRQPYACSKCGETKSDTLPALGHDWQVKQSVNTQYDDTGQLVQEGYTIYECTRCGEQNRTTSGAGPPPSGGGDAPGGEEDASIWDKLGDLLGTLITGVSGLLGSVLGKLLEALTSLSQLILDGLGTVVETVLSLFDSVPQLFGDFLAFLSAVFPFLPEEMVTLLTFGLAAVVFIGILKAVRK